jgi:hypothetical protein
LEDALKAAGKGGGKVLIYRVADSGKWYRLARKYNKTLHTPPKQGALLRKEDSYEPRKDAIKVIGGLGNDRIARSIWAKDGRVWQRA